MKLVDNNQALSITNKELEMIITLYLHFTTDFCLTIFNKIFQMTLTKVVYIIHLRNLSIYCLKRISRKRTKS
jgi:hypothetical protein